MPLPFQGKNLHACHKLHRAQKMIHCSVKSRGRRYAALAYLCSPLGGRFSISEQGSWNIAKALTTTFILDNVSYFS
jgi:hypothetical protein